MRNANLLNTGLLLMLAGTACATAAAPPELLAARASYDRAARGVAATLDPADLHTARKAVEVAEQSYRKDGDTQETRDLAYAGDRRAQIAEARANALQAIASEQKTLNDMHATQTAELGRANQQLTAQGLALDSERDARAAADKRAAQATADLANFATVKQETRGMVITLSGSVLFASSKADLLPEAQVKLNGVADALTQQDPDSKMVVEGHTDSQGGAGYNQELSQRRARSVRDYLVSRGIAADRVTSQGFGASRSVADNTSAEGRANNRRVEIVVEPANGRAI